MIGSRRLEREGGQRPSIVVTTKKVPKLPKFPTWAQTFQRKRSLSWKMVALENYLQNILKIPCFKNFRDTLEFLEVGPFSFVEDLGAKGKEGFVTRRSDCGDTGTGILCTVICGFRKRRWLFMKETFLGLMKPSSGELECVLLLDRGFQIKSGRKGTGYSQVLVLKNLNRKLILQCESNRQAREWAEEVNFVLHLGSEYFVTPNRYESFAPPRSLTECKWIVDGATYFEAVALALEGAKEEIFLADWWLSPEIYLKRPTTHGHYWQLDYLLRRKARQGVRVYVLLYKELELALGINSFHTEQKLSKMHPNIQVLRHPYVSKGVLLWAHHEKIVCVDQTYAFVGGLDLCYGRWDDYQHRLADLGETEEKLKVKRHMSTTSKPSLTELEEERRASLPDITETTRLFENIKRNLSLEDLREHQANKMVFSEQPADQNRTVREMALVHLGLECKFRLWHGKDYVNFINKDFQDLHQPYSDMINRSTTPRMPWHDVALYTQGMVARDIARHFILRWNQAKEENCPKDSSKSYLMPKCYSIFVENLPPILQETVGNLYRAECQVLRSLCFWSGNISCTENSIHNAYIGVIREAKNFIYIENQFFISQPEGHGYVYNEIADALFSRILKAHREKKDFHVYVVLPLLPAFEGEVGTGSGTLIQAVTHWNYKSICRGSDSLKGRLARHMKDTSKYISFYGLRTHGTLADKPVTELVYVHSKILVADDNVAIIGSANINDRSLLGRRDSEIAIIVKDTNLLEDHPHDGGTFCYSLRTALFKEHLGLMQQPNPKIDLRDPSKSEFRRDVWNKTAVMNTKIYEEVFRCLPTDKVTNFTDLKKYQLIANLATTDPEAAKEKLKHIRGYLVHFPLFFLCDENLEPHLTTMEHYLPSSIFT